MQSVLPGLVADQQPAQSARTCRNAARTVCQPLMNLSCRANLGQSARRYISKASTHSGVQQRCAVVAAASPMQQLQQIFSRGSPYKSASKELQSMIQEGSEDVQRFGELVVILLDSELPFKESALGGGEWQVVYTRGALLWQQLTSPGGGTQSGRLSYKSKRKAAQEFSPDERTVINRGDVLGSQLTVCAQGTYELQDTHSNLPKLVKANISSGQATALGRAVPLPFRGSGFFSIMYVDEAVRVFSDQKRGTVSVQVQAERLEQLLKR